jgi:SWI/SNF-related matrix-associated actin-dependent regulator of chromatin subfamily A-like protein 1
MNISQNKYHYIVQIPPQVADFRRKLEAVKKIPGRQWLDDQKAWAIPVKNYADTKSLMTAISNMVANPFQRTIEDDYVIEPLPELTIHIPLKKEMYGFQKKGTAYNLVHGSSMIGDTQGLGKTIQAIASAVAMDLFPCLVITKKTLVLNWKQEWEDWTDKEVMPLSISKKNTWQFFFKTGMADVGIVNYESLSPFFVNKILVPPGEQFRVKHIHFKEDITMFKSVIIDESHYVKDGKTKRTKFCIGLTKHLQERGVFLLSGTPVLNDPMELYTQLTILQRQHLFGSYTQFKATYSGKHNRRNLKQLNYLLHKHCYYRREKSEAKADLPPKTWQVILCDIDNREEYNLAEQHFVKYLREKLALSEGEINQKLRGEVMVQMGILKKIAAKGKLEAVKEWTNSLLEEKEKVVLFAYHKEIQLELVASFKNAVAIGAQDVTPMLVIQENKRRFQETKDTNVIVCSISAAAEGHTLNAASNLGNVELPWHYGKLEQISDRIHRITNWLPANITTFLAQDTIDRYIYDLIMDKKEMHNSITGAADDVQEAKVIDKLISIFNQR